MAMKLRCSSVSVAHANCVKKRDHRLVVVFVYVIMNPISYHKVTLNLFKLNKPLTTAYILQTSHQITKPLT